MDPETAKAQKKINDSSSEDEELDLTIATVDTEQRSSLVQLLTDAIGIDITRITVPVSYNEPTTFIQRVMEAYTHCYLLRVANQVVATDPDLAMLYVGAFSLSTFAVAIQRVSKPFNPLLGETFEYCDPKRGMNFYGEQVSHHPPITAGVLETEHFLLVVNHKVSTRFTGNAIELEPASFTEVTLKATGTKYTYRGIQSTLYNVLVGGPMWIDMYGEVLVTEVGHPKRKASLNCTKCGWFSAGWHELNGTIFNDQGKPEFLVDGKWNETLYATRKNAPPAGAEHAEKKRTKKRSFPWHSVPFDLSSDDIPEFHPEKKQPFWTNVDTLCKETPFSQWKMTQIARDGCWFDNNYQAVLPKSDSRLRPDRIALEKLDYETAAKDKHKLEEAQRARRRKAEETKKFFVPVYFDETSLDDGTQFFTPKNTYWKKRQERIEKAAGGTSPK
jgi:hypothetical protein